MRRRIKDERESAIWTKHFTCWEIFSNTGIMLKLVSCLRKRISSKISNWCASENLEISVVACRVPMMLSNFAVAWRLSSDFVTFFSRNFKRRHHMEKANNVECIFLVFMSFSIKFITCCPWTSKFSIYRFNSFLYSPLILDLKINLSRIANFCPLRH